MSLPAHVSDIQALSAFRPSLIRFSEDIQRTLTGPGSDAGRVVSWLQRERLPYWKREIRVRSEEAVRANTKLVQQTSSQSPRPSVDARKAFELAKRRVREAQEKFEITRRSIQKMEKAIKQYRTAIQPMASIARADMSAAVAKLDGYIAALDAYTSVSQKHSPAQSKEQEDTQGNINRGEQE